MAKLTFNHSEEEWIEKLTVPEQELSAAEREAIAEHIATCPDCDRIVADFAALPSLLELRPAPKITPGLPPRLLQLWEEEEHRINWLRDRGLSLPKRIETNTSSALPGTDRLPERQVDQHSHDTRQPEPTAIERLFKELME